MNVPTTGAGDPLAAQKLASEQPAPDMTAGDHRGTRVPGFNPSVPNPARMYDYYLGGKDNFAADREADEQALSVVPFGREAFLLESSFVKLEHGREIGYGFEGLLQLETFGVWRYRLLHIQSAGVGIVKKTSRLHGALFKTPCD
jgi:hypothetical protein